MLVAVKMRHGFQSRWFAAVEGYPASARKKMRACLVTYRHSAGQQFEKPEAPRAKVKEM
jgi:hypothetical protein